MKAIIQNRIEQIVKEFQDELAKIKAEIDELKALFDREEKPVKSKKTKSK